MQSLEPLVRAKKVSFTARQWVKRAGVFVVVIVFSPRKKVERRKKILPGNILHDALEITLHTFRASWRITL